MSDDTMVMSAPVAPTTPSMDASVTEQPHATAPINITSAQADKIIGELAKINATLSANVNNNTMICAPNQEVKQEALAAAPVSMDASMGATTQAASTPSADAATTAVTATPTPVVLDAAVQPSAQALTPTA